MKHLRVLFLMFLPVIFTGCASMLPTENNVPHNHWKSYEQAQSDFEKIVPHTTTLIELKKMGFDPTNSSNIKILTYLDITHRFLHTPSMIKNDLPPDVLQCLEAKDGCQGFELNIESISKKRYGSVPLDILGFKKNTHITGWSFKALIIVQDGVVSYKLSSGEPRIDKYEKRGKPLGPFQELDNIVTKIPGMF